jgi:dihydrofolate reductase
MTRKLKVLLLHGYAQSAVAFRSKTGSVRKESKKLADFVFAAAPHPLSAAQLAARRAATKRPASSSSARQIEADDEGVATWWHFDHAAQTYDEASLDASLDALETVFRNEGPFDGVGGFSQGACLSLILASRLQRGLLSERSAIAFDFVMLFSGFLPHDEHFTATMRDYERRMTPHKQSY